MTAPRTSSDSDHLRHIRRSLQDAPRDLRSVYTDGIGQLVSEGDDLVDDGVVATFTPAAAHQWVTVIGNAPAWCQFLLELLDEAFATIRRERAARPAVKPDDAPRPSPDGKIKVQPGAKYAAHCASTCQEPEFSEFLICHYGMAEGDDPVDCIREVLNIESRAALNAAGKWIRINKEYRHWKKKR